MERLSRNLPRGFGYEWTGLAFQEKLAGGQTVYIFAFSLLFVFLVLAALYESWAIPLGVLLGLPIPVFGALLGGVGSGVWPTMFTCRWASSCSSGSTPSCPS
jgi:multidrug efflux pump